MSALLAPPEELRLWEAGDVEAVPRERPVQPSATVARARWDTQAGAPGGATLGDVVADAWEALAVGASASCPCCGEALRPRWSAGSGLVGGRCDGCDARIE